MNLVKILQPRSWRTEKTQNEYVEYRNTILNKGDFCPLCKANTLVDFTYWRIIPNDFPYDAIAETHHQITPKRHCVEDDLREVEIQELLTLKKEFLTDYYTIMAEALPKSKSIPGHHHLHLLVPKVMGK